MRWSAVWLMIRPARSGLASAALPVFTFAVITAAVVARLFWLAPDNDFGVYQLMAAALVCLIVVPVGALGAAAARLSARRRDDRLATLRLLGARSRWVRGVAMAESTITAGVGVLLGGLAHLATAPLLTLLPVQGRTPALAQVWLPWWVLAAAGVALVAIALVSAVTGLRAVVLSPLGVRRRCEVPRLSALRMLIGGAVLAGAVGVLQLVSPGWGSLGIAAGLGGSLVAVMAVLGVVGPFVIGRVAGFRLARTGRAVDLLACRAVLDSPKAAWRQVSGVALAAFLVVPIGSLLGYLDLIERETPGLDTATRMAFADGRTVMLFAVGLAYLLVACSVGVTQAAAVLERRRLYVSLDRVGMPVAALNRARLAGVLLPLRVASLGSALTATVMFFWLVQIAATSSPLFLMGVAVLLLIGELLVRAAVSATRPVLGSVLAHPQRSL